MVRETDPEKRAHLHAVRALIMVADKALALAVAAAHQAEIGTIGMIHAQQTLHEEQLKIVEKLRTN